ncbi:MAG: hypothetical protein K2X06_15745, partial [Burkholderiales bacterium]|nr:hypothetical protein [Burkholderiales bacterium]
LQGNLLGIDYEKIPLLADTVLRGDYRSTNVFGNNGICASACVISFVGGVARLGLGKGRIGLHRPYTTAFSSTTTEAQYKYDLINTKLTQYLKLMNITPRLLEAMNAIPPESMKWLSLDSLSDERTLYDLNILGVDPVWQDGFDSSQAKKYGITKSEYYQRRQKARALCNSAQFPNLNEANVCFELILQGKF